MPGPHLVDRYHYTVEWDETKREHIARCQELPQLTGRGDTAAWALASLKGAVAGIVRGMLEQGEHVPEPRDEPFSTTT